MLTLNALANFSPGLRLGNHGYPIVSKTPTLKGVAGFCG